MISVIYDYQAFAMQKQGGISRYFANIISGLNTRSEVEATLAIQNAENVYLEEILSMQVASPLKISDYCARGLSLEINERRNQRAAIRALRQHPLSTVFHPTYFDPYSIPKLRTTPMVVTVHDMIYELFPDKIHDEKLIENKKIMIQEAAHIITVSHSTQKDLVNFFPEAASKSSVIYHGTSFSCHKESGTPLFDGLYLLFVGNRGEYKNFDLFLRAFAVIVQDIPDLKLLCVGGGPFSSHENNLIAKFGLQDKVKHSFANEMQLKNLYAHCQLFVFPSLYEGFGLPVLEAMACGAVCAISSTSSLPEVGGFAAEYFNPESTESICETIINLLKDCRRREQLREAGYMQIKSFSWQNSVDKHLDVYRRLV